MGVSLQIGFIIVKSLGEFFYNCAMLNIDVTE